MSNIARERESGGPSSLKFSPELLPLIDNLDSVSLASGLPSRLNPLLRHLTDKIDETMRKMEEKGSQFEICGPDWCREHPDIAGKAHAQVIIQTYGATYALPNKDPEANKKALASGELDMYMIFENGIPVGTACMVIGSNGWAELGRSASLGGVGNQLIQDLRIARWLTEEPMAKNIVGIFSTCRTAPDRNIGTEEQPEIMRGGQAVTHIWARLPEVRVGGFGPLYKKHGALEQFAYAFITNREVQVPEHLWIASEEDREFVKNWTGYYQIPISKERQKPETVPSNFRVHYPPLETGLTHLIHGEITLENEGESFSGLDQALARLDEVKVPFIQVNVPVDKDYTKLQRMLVKRGFQAFLFTPGIEGKQPPLLWFGRVTKGTSVVPTFWEEGNSRNPFWNEELARQARKIARGWK